MHQVIYRRDGSIVAVHHDRDDEPPTTKEQSVLSVVDDDWPDDFDFDSYAVDNGDLTTNY